MRPFFYTPFNFGLYSVSVNHWVPTAFIGGGFSREFIDLIRINAGVFYDVILIVFIYVVKYYHIFKIRIHFHRQNRLIHVHDCFAIVGID